MNSMKLLNSLDIKKVSNKRNNGILQNRNTSFESINSFKKLNLKNTSSTFLSRKFNETASSSKDNFQRPITAVQSVGYVSKGRDFKRSLSTSDSKAENKIATIERDIKSMVDESLELLDENNKLEGINRAKEALIKENNLESIYEQYDISKEVYNFQLKFLVLINLCGHYESSSMLNDALEIYDQIVRNDNFPSGYRYLLNMGNIYFRQKHFSKALKMFQIVLDKVPRKEKAFRLKILHNYTIVLIKNGKFKDAITNLQYMLHETKTDHKIAYHLLIIFIILGSSNDELKQALEALILIPYKRKTCLEQIVNDDLNEYELKRRQKIEQYILIGSKLVLRQISVSENFDWLIKLIKKSDFANLCHHLEIFKIILLIKNGHVKTALDSLKNFDQKSTLPPSVTLSLSFLYYSLGDFKKAGKSAQATLESKSCTNQERAGAFNNLGVCSLQKTDYEMAREYFLQSLRLCDQLIEPKFNLSLVYKEKEQFDQALFNLQVIDDSFASMPNVVCKKAQIFEALQDFDAAFECYQQLLALVPTDSKVLQKLGEMTAIENDKEQTSRYFLDAYHYLPSNMQNLKKLASHYMQSAETIDKSLAYFIKGTQFQPEEIEWYFQIAEFYRKTGNLYKCFQFYQNILDQFPDNVHCLRELIELCSILAKKDLSDKYQLMLKNTLRSVSVRTRTAALSTAAMSGTQFVSKAYEKSLDSSDISETDNDVNIINFDKSSDEISFSIVLPE